MEQHLETETVKIDQLVQEVKSFLAAIEDGDMSVSAYDTAWVALIDNMNEIGVPQFPSSLSWIVDHQLSDGSWGYEGMFLAGDRILNTLACVIVLKKWNVYPNKYQKGLLFLRDNINLLGEDNVEHMLGGFEIVFPPLVDMARSLHIQIPDCDTIFHDIYAKRNLKLTRIPNERMHSVATTLLYSLEGMQDLKWEKLLKLQFQDGSFMSSPSSTAFAFMQTRDTNCLAYLNNVTKRFNGGVPSMHPIDLYERLWAVDRLQRLGISRFFKAEIEEYINYIHRCWTKDGISWTRNSRLRDTDCSAMGFRCISRIHECNGEFQCYEGQWNEGISVMSNLYRASQLMFPQEKILHDARTFSAKFLRQKQNENKLIDKWILTTDLPGEVAFALDVPWYACLPRLEARFYIEQYGAEDVVWIAKTLYKVPYIDNKMYLELAKLDYNHCQALHRIELITLYQWYEACKFEDFGVSRQSLLWSYFMAASTIFESERAIERFAWAKTIILLETITSYFEMSDQSTISSFVTQFQAFLNPDTRFETKTTTHKIIQMLLTYLNQCSLDASKAYGEDVMTNLSQLWEKWLLKWKDNQEHGEVEVLVQTLNLVAGRKASTDTDGPTYNHISVLANKICSQLKHHQKYKDKVHVELDGKNIENLYKITPPRIEKEMQALVELTLNNSVEDGMDYNMKQTFLAVTRCFYYRAFFDRTTIESHIARVLFQKVC